MASPYLAFYTVRSVFDDGETHTSNPMTCDDLYAYVTEKHSNPLIDEVFVFGHMKDSQDGEVVEIVLLDHLY